MVQAVCCLRPVWNDENECIWHADKDEKPISELQVARTDVPETIEGIILRNSNLGNAISFENCTMRDGDFSGGDFTGADFSDAHMPRSDFSNATLREASFSNSEVYNSTFKEASVWEADLSNSDLKKSDFCNSSVSRSDFSYSKLHNSRFVDSSAHDVDFSNAHLEGVNLSQSTLSGSNFSNTLLVDSCFDDSNINKVNFSKASLPRSSFIGSRGDNPKFIDCKLEKAQFIESELNNPNFTKSNLKATDFSDASLSRGDFSQADLREATLTGADLTNTDFSGADLHGADFSGADLSNANLSGANLEETSFESAQLQQANLEEANLKRSRLEDCDLNSAVVKNANLERAVLTQADLFNANLTGSDLYGAVLADVRLNDETNFGFHYLEEPEKALWTHRQIQELFRKNALPKQARRSYLQRKKIRRKQFWEKATIPPFIQGIVRQTNYFRVNNVLARKYRSYVTGNHAKVSKYGNAFYWLKSSLSDLIMRYGEGPWRVISISLLVIMVSALVYPVFGIKSGTQIHTYPPIGRLSSEKLFHICNLLVESLYFSTVTFTTLGYGDLQPVGLAKIISAIESFLGALLMALLVFVLGRRTTW